MKSIILLLLGSVLLTFCACQSSLGSEETNLITETHESETGTFDGIVAETETEIETETEREIETETETEKETETETEIEMETETETETEIEMETETEAETEAETIDPRMLYEWYWTNDSYTYINGDATPWIGDEEEYRAFLQCFKNFLPESFIKYDQFSELGKFSSMVVLSYDGSQYTYTINDEDPQYAQYDYGVYNICFRITCLSKEDSRNILDYKSEEVQAKIHHETGELVNMAISAYDISVLHHVKYHNVIYTYDPQGELLYMDMIIDDYRIHFSRGNQKIGKEYIDCYFKDYAPAEPNFITLLLEGAEYEEVANSFRKMIATADE